MEMTKEANILIVEDQEINIRLLKGMLIKEGYTNVILTSDAREAVPMFRDFQPDLVLLDLHMPHLDGFEIMDRLSELTWGDYMPILVLTGDMDPQTRQRALACGAMDFVNKPFKVAEVMLRVNNFLQARLLHLQLKSENNSLMKKEQAKALKFEATHLGLLEGLADVAERRGDHTGNHCNRVADMAARLGEKLGMNAESVKLLQRAAPFHDVGKIAVPDRILLKPGQLDDDETAVMREHVNAGVRLLQDGHGEMIKMAAEIALTHHEKWDGSGYPQGLKGEEIPLVGRIVALADVYDALIHERPYKEAWSVERARAEILSLSGQHFDPAVVSAFFNLVVGAREMNFQGQKMLDEAKMRSCNWPQSGSEGANALSYNAYSG